MGQCFVIANADRKECICPWDLSNGYKLMEWAHSGNQMNLALTNKIAGDWKGDRVYVLGDYADETGPGEEGFAAVAKMLDENGIEPPNLFPYVYKNFKNISDDCDVEDYGYRYLYNHKTRQVIDLAKLPIEWGWYSKEEKQGGIVSIAPLPVLIAIGNGRGGGDYYGVNEEYAGSWCDSIEHVEFSREPIDRHDEYELFAPDFTERSEKVTYDRAEEMIEKAKAFVLSLS